MVEKFAKHENHYVTNVLYMMFANRQGRYSMTKQMRRLIETFTKVGVTGPAIVQEIARFRVLDQIITQSGEVREWGITPKELF